MSSVLNSFKSTLPWCISHLAAGGLQSCASSESIVLWTLPSAPAVEKKGNKKQPSAQAKPEVVSLSPHVASVFNGTNFSFPWCGETILGRRQVCWCHLAFSQRYHHTDGRVIILLNKNGNGCWNIWLPCWILLLFQKRDCAVGGRVRGKNFSFYTAEMKSFLQLMFISWLMTLKLKRTMWDVK